MGGITSILLTRKPRPERQGNWPKITQHKGQPGSTVVLVAVGRRRREVDALSHREGHGDPWNIGGVKEEEEDD